MRYFNIYGPVNETEHYVVPRTQLVADLVAQIERGTYFTIYAPRQMGKTTLLRRLRDVLLSKENYLPVTLSFGGMENWPVSDFLQAFSTRLSQGIVEVLQANSEPALAKVNQLTGSHPPTSFYTLRNYFDDLHQLLPQYHLVQIIDEIDGMPQSVISDLLQTWREIYLSNQPPRSIHSVALIGIQNIASLNLGRSSPFNIARQVELPLFTLPQVQHLLNQYTTETGQAFAKGVIEEIHELTNGHPFLVNRLAALLTEEIATDRTHPISHANLRTALSKLVRERNYNYETLVRHAKSYQEQVLRILFGARLKFSLNTPWVNELNMQGVLLEDSSGFCQIANPIYKRILTDYFQPLESDLQASILVNSYDLSQHVVGDELQMDILLSRFRQFIERRGAEAFRVTPTPHEATGQYLLMAYLDLLMRLVGGDLFTEIDSGKGRLDLITVYRGHRYVIETKIWDGRVKFEQGLDQLERYLESESQSVGYYVVFHARPRVYGKLTHDELEFVVQRERVKIHVYLVRLEALFKKKKK